MRFPRLSNKALNKAEEKILRNIEKYGWHVVLIPESANTPGWAFSIGLYHTFNHPEVAVFGLSYEIGHKVINTVGEDVRSGKVYESGKEYPAILEGVLCMFQAVEKCWYPPFFGYASWFYQGDQFPVLQCIWPDKQQNYPWSPNFRRDWLWAQPLLFHVDPVKANVEELLRSVYKAQHDNPLSRQNLKKTDSIPVLKGHDTIVSSHHRFDPGEWPFPDPEHTEAFTTSRVIEENYPILFVTHDEDGAWQILCGTTNDPEHARSICLGCMYEKDRTIGELADLPRGWKAWRASRKEPWQRRQMGR